ncbi:Sorbin and SH3 domain-containing protein 1 [Trichinella pseudospiralis]|uniref:Sorbin and SH3 domain-containing protein 1 n=1 Tax=Trichinella pseudospiralis TaxID=6337 RepID=A0A0V0Y648_TRIPS|nr:Sorbin and SH3 domain-containing protein 1 [Trichinella pseudospiralis]
MLLRQNDDVRKLVVDGVVYGKADPLEAILNEMKLYSASLQSKPNETKSTTSLFSPGRSVSTSTKRTSPATSQIDTYEAIYEYLPANSDELELKRGDIVYVVECCDDGWFIGTSLRTGKFGTFPGNYVKHL